MKTIADLCKAHCARTYFVDPTGLIGVYNHRNRVLWYFRNSVTGRYTLSGETAHPGHATRYTLSNNSECPKCQSEDIKGQPVDVGDNCATQDCTCFVCSHTWTAHYTYTGLTIP